MFSFANISLDNVINSSDDSDYVYSVICDINCTDKCKDITRSSQIPPLKRKVEKNELGYRDREKNLAKSSKLILDQNHKVENPIHYRMIRFVFSMGEWTLKFIE